jgi:excisionase family DNA binding protein
VTALETALEALIEALADRVAERVARKLERGGPAADQLVDVATFARERSIAVSTVRRAIREGRLEAVHIGRSVRVRRDAVVARSAASPAPAGAASTDRVALRLLKGCTR